MIILIFKILPISKCIRITNSVYFFVSNALVYLTHVYPTASYPFSHLSLTPTDVYNGAKSDYIQNILPKSTDRTMSLIMAPSSETPSNNHSRSDHRETSSSTEITNEDNNDSNISSEPIF